MKKKIKKSIILASSKGIGKSIAANLKPVSEKVVGRPGVGLVVAYQDGRKTARRRVVSPRIWIYRPLGSQHGFQG